MLSLIKIGNRVLNLTHVVQMEIESDDLVSVTTLGPEGPQPLLFSGDEARALIRFVCDDRYVHECPVGQEDFGVIFAS